MSKQIERNYNGSDAFMLESADTMQASFVLDQAEFMAFDTQLTVEFGTDWKTAIDEAYAEENDTAIVAQIGVETGEVEAAMQKCREAYIDVIYFAEKAFPNIPMRLKQFGQGKSYEKAYRSHSKMVDFMDELVAATTRYSVELTSVGCPAPVLAKPATALAELRNLNINQNQSIKGRPALTTERIILLNTVFDIMRTVTEAAKRVYRSNPAKQGIYTYNPETSGGNDISSGSLAPSEVRTVVPAGVIDRETALIKVENKGTTTLRVAITELPGTPPIDAATLIPEAELSLSGVSLPVLSQYLLVIQNLSTTEPGNYRVEVED